MTEQEWLAATDPQPMLEFLIGQVSDRKIRLFQVACCRRIWSFMPNDACREAVVLAEQYADGEVSDKKRQAMRNQIAAISPSADLVAINAGYAAFHANEKTIRKKFAVHLSVAVVFGRVAEKAAKVKDKSAYKKAYKAEQVAETQLLRCLIGNPFRPITLDPSWLTSTVIALAKEMYESRDFSAMPILADALQDAGCENEVILQHCRGPGPHCRGCWPIDLLLGKE